MMDTNLVEIIINSVQVSGILQYDWFSDGWFIDDKNLAVVPTPFFVDSIWIKPIGHRLRQSGYRLVNNVLVVPLSDVRKFLNAQVKVAA